MNTIQQNPLQSSHIKEPEVPNLFYFILGMILVFGSGVTADGQNSSLYNSTPTEIKVRKNQEKFTSEFPNTSNTNLVDVKGLSKENRKIFR